MTEETTLNGDVTIAYELLGGPPGDPLLLVMGLGGQLVDWPDGFCSALTDRNFAVARFDNRDTGRSTHFTNARRPTPLGMFLQPRRPPPYHLEDMAGDSWAVMDALGWERAHLVGSSLGGMIVQTMAIGHPERVVSLTSISSTPHWRLSCHRIRSFLRVAWTTRHSVTTQDEAAQQSVDVNRIVGSHGYPFDEDGIRLRAKLAFERGQNPDGVSRQAAATIKGPDRRRLLSTLEVPALVIHGQDDRAIKVKCGRETADAIPGSRFLAFPGMGHDLPELLWPAIADAIRAVADCAAAS